jgi:hypothetical protein
LAEESVDPLGVRAAVSTLGESRFPLGQREAALVPPKRRRDLGPEAFAAERIVA